MLQNLLCKTCHFLVPRPLSEQGVLCSQTWLGNLPEVPVVNWQKLRPLQAWRNADTNSAAVSDQGSMQTAPACSHPTGSSLSNCPATSMHSTCPRCCCGRALNTPLATRLHYCIVPYCKWEGIVWGSRCCCGSSRPVEVGLRLGE